MDTLPSAPSAPSASAHVRSSRSDPSALEEQIRAMDRIREALAAGDGRRALAQIDDYERRYPRGAFVEEAEVDRIDALVRTGDRAGAGRAAERFLARWPASPHGARVRALVGATTP